MSSDEARSRYTFGDTPLAAERLLLVARVFEAPSRSFLTESVIPRPRVALDLGCGPGETTRLVSATTGAEHTIGLDTSHAFIEIARRHESSTLEFVVHDATQLPLPHAPVDLIYCRLLLAHLPDVAATVTALTTQLTVGGRLLVDEVEWIESRQPVFAAYERAVVDLVASRGAPMYAGPIVDALRRGIGWEQCSSRERVVPVTTADAARMFGMNLATWRDDPHVRGSHDPAAIDRLAAELADLAGSAGTGEITWGLRQVAYERTAAPD